MKIVTAIALSTLAGTAVADDTITQDRQVENYHAIAFSIPGNLYVTQSGDESLRIEADEDVIDDIITEVDDGVLIIRRERSMWWTRMGRVDVYVNIDDFEELVVSGSGNAKTGAVETEEFALKVSGSGSIDMESLECAQVRAAVSGSGEVEVAELTAGAARTRIGGSGEVKWRGAVDDQSISISGSGDYHGADLTSQEAEVVVSGSGDVRVRVEKALDVVVSGSGSVRYYGDPEVSKVVAGSGNVKRG